jgi:heme exporter protein A
MSRSPARLEVRDLVVERGEFKLETAISFTASAHALIHLKGANGSGKTTALRAMAGLVTPTAGTLVWHGISIENNPVYLAALNYVGHLNGLSAELSALENLEFMSRISCQAQIRSAAEALALVRASAFAERPVRQLSAGQRRRAALARLALFDCPLWMLDEPFTALDAESRILLENLIDAHLDDGGIAIVATHQAFGCRHPATQMTLGGPAG